MEFMDFKPAFDFNVKVQSMIDGKYARVLGIEDQFLKLKDRWDALPTPPTRANPIDVKAQFELYSTYWDLFEDLHVFYREVKQYIDTVLYGRVIEMRSNMDALRGVRAMLPESNYGSYSYATADRSPNYPKLKAAYADPEDYAKDRQAQIDFTAKWDDQRRAYEALYVMCDDARQVLRLILPIGPAFLLKNGIWVRRENLNAPLKAGSLNVVLGAPADDVEVPF